MQQKICYFKKAVSSKGLFDIKYHIHLIKSVAHRLVVYQITMTPPAISKIHTCRKNNFYHRQLEGSTKEIVVLCNSLYKHTAPWRRLYSRVPFYARAYLRTRYANPQIMYIGSDRSRS